MNYIKQTRAQLGYTQKTLAEKTGLSLRTIQRLEASNKTPKGHTLTELAKALGVTPNILQEKFQINDLTIEASDKAAIKFINLSILAFFIFPMGNILAPFWVWRKKRGSKLVEEVGRRIINVQIFWTISLYCLLCIAPFLNTDFPLILWVLFFGVCINLILFIATAYWTQRGNFSFLNLPINLL